MTMGELLKSQGSTLLREDGEEGFTWVPVSKGGTGASCTGEERRGRDGGRDTPSQGWEDRLRLS